MDIMEIRNAIFDVIKKHLKPTNLTLVDFYKNKRNREKQFVELRRQIFKDLFNQGLSMRFIAETFNFERSTVRDLLQRERIKTNKAMRIIYPNLKKTTI